MFWKDFAGGVPGRTEGYWQLEAPVEATGFYDQSGEVIVPGYSH
jgi:hypothetical protein